MYGLWYPQMVKFDKPGMVYDNMIGCSTLVCVIYIYIYNIYVFCFQQIYPTVIHGFSEAIFYHSIHASDPTDPYSWLLTLQELHMLRFFEHGSLERPSFRNRWFSQRTKPPWLGRGISLRPRHRWHVGILARHVMGDAPIFLFWLEHYYKWHFFCMGKSARYGGFNGNLLDSWRF
jgi:hypothetical protein